MQEFPIGVCGDLLSLLQVPGMEHITNFTKSAMDHVDKMERITRHVHLAELKKKFKDLRLSGWFEHKFLYPFKSPILVILSMFYTFLLVGFVVCGPVEFLSWPFAAMAIGYITNTHIFTIGLVWATFLTMAWPGLFLVVPGLVIYRCFK